MKILKSAFVAVMCSIAVLAMADVPNGYYSSLNGKSGQELKNAVHTLTRNHTVLTYNSLWYYFQSTDHMPSNTRQVWDMYSNNTYYFNGSSAVSGMNKEHSLPKSWWGGGTNTSSYPSYTDINHLYPSDAKANSAKSNWPLGEVSTASFDNGVCRTGSPKSGMGGGAGTVFEPDDQYKGDFARTYFYMACCYQDYTWRYHYMVTETDWKTLTPWAISMLLKWSREDPVSDKEKQRNDAVFKVQNNRNPFIDNPNLAEYIWGNKAGQVFNENDTTGTGGGGTGGGGDKPDSTKVPVLITPTQGTVLDFGEVALGKSIDYVIPVKGKNLTQNLSTRIYLNNAAMFKANVSSIDRVIANSQDGYPLHVTYTPTAVGNHKTKLLIYDGGITGSVGIQITAACLPVPTLTTVRALPAQDITDSTYVATWEASTDTIDYYIIDRTIYDSGNSIVGHDTTVVDADETSYTFTDLKHGQTHVYTIRTSRLGYTSVPSNAINVTFSSVTGIEDDNNPLAIIPVEGGVLVKSSQDLGATSIYTIDGRLVRHIANLTNDTVIELPRGLYVLTTRTRIAKLAVK